MDSIKNCLTSCVIFVFPLEMHPVYYVPVTLLDEYIKNMNYMLREDIIDEKMQITDRQATQIL